MRPTVAAIFFGLQTIFAIADERSITNKLATCVAEQASSENYSSADGEKSAIAILQAWPMEAGAFLSDYDNRGVQQDRCNMMAVMDAQFTLKMKGY